MVALLSALAIQALVSMTVLMPPVLAVLAAPGIGVMPERVGIFTAIVYGGAIVTSSGSYTLAFAVIAAGALIGGLVAWRQPKT